MSTISCKRCPYTSRRKAAMLMHERMSHQEKARVEEVKMERPRKRPDIVQYGNPLAKFVSGTNNECSLCPADTREVFISPFRLYKVDLDTIKIQMLQDVSPFEHRCVYKEWRQVVKEGL